MTWFYFLKLVGVYEPTFVSSIVSEMPMERMISISDDGDSSRKNQLTFTDASLYERFVARRGEVEALLVNLGGKIS